MKVIDISPRFNELHPSVQACQLVEIRIVARVLRAILATGEYVLKGIDADDFERVKTFEQAMKLIFDLDEARVYFSHVKTKQVEWVLFVMGNDGWDVVSDYTCNEKVFDGAIEAATDEDRNDLGNEEV